MFRSILSKSLRDYRVPMLAWGVGLGLFMVAVFGTATPAVVTAFISLARIVSFLGDLYAMNTPQGYITFRYMETSLPVLLSIWPILAGARLVRGEEERGSMDVLLATPEPRTRLLLEKVGALFLALLVIAVLFALGIVGGEASLRIHIDFVGALLAGLNLGLLAFFFGMVALLLSQMTITRGAAAGWAGALLVLFMLLAMMARELSGTWVQYLSPFYYYNLNRPLLAGFPDQPLGALLLLGLSVLCLAGSVVLFDRRDIGRSAFELQRERASSTQQARRSLSRAERKISTRTVSLHTLFAEGWSSFWWLLGIAAFCAAILFVTPGLQKAFNQAVQQTPWLAAYLYDTPTNTNAAFLGTLIFAFVPAIVVILALTLAMKWSSDLENGRLELIFSTPLSRPRILLENFGANLIVILLAPVLTWLVITIGAQLSHIPVDQGRVLAASFSMLPPALITSGLVYALAGRLRYGVVLGLVTAYLVLSYIQESLEGNIQFPGWLMSLSIFHLYGNPVFVGMDWTSFLGMTAVGIALLLIGLVQFRHADIQLG
ncbi:MAG TPA: ABC transporter permease subunit [Ktedonobacteraceae bacterium]|nr:ABC transporter permease subunit [Ktedonobacteraceae bacterium]